uniref:Uncharacterized protein n=1 Tax=Anopheles minimus TaxID=112268 RepID=A0A182WNU6_9DIPT
MEIVLFMDRSVSSGELEVRAAAKLDNNFSYRTIVVVHFCWLLWTGIVELHIRLLQVMNYEYSYGI